MTELTLIMAVYGQPLMLREQFLAITAYPQHVREQLRVIVVDDCGTPPVEVGTIAALAQVVKEAWLYRVDKDIPWNQMGARNLAMQHAGGVCLLIDPDMVFDGKTMERMIEAAKKLARGHVVKWGLRHVNSGKVDMTSPNTWMIHRGDFFAVGGYDEDYAGNKGWSDVQFLDVMRACYKIELRADLCADFHGTDSIPDAMVKTLDRSTAANKKKRLKKVAQARAAGGWARWAKTRTDVPRLRFPWSQIYPTA